MRIFYILAFLLGLANIITAQNLGCDGNRFVNEVFMEITETIGVQFGQNTTLGGNQKDLLMDIYEPTGDNLEMRPAIVLAHGGSFIAGNRTNLKGMCEDFAKRGFVAVTIDYRLIDIFVFDSIGFGEGVVQTISDMKAAIRFLREDAATNNLYRINPDYVFAGGVSAGGVIASHVEYLGADDTPPNYIEDIINMNGGYEGNSSDNFEYSSEIQGVLNYSGSLTRTNFIDANDPPLFSAHDENDAIVPCGYGDSDAVFFPLFSFGSCEMHPILEEFGIFNEFYFKANSDGHVSYLSGAENDIVIQQSAEFLETIYCGAATETNEIIDQSLNIEVFPNPVIDIMNVQLDDEFPKGHLILKDMTGRTIWNQIIQEPNITFEIPTLNWAKGIYILSFVGVQKVSSKKIVIQ